MKQFFIFLLVLSAKVSQGQTYRYYFLEVRATGKMEIAVKPEFDAQYPDIDSLVCVRTTDNRGKEIMKERKYLSYSDMFNKLSAAGLEFVQFAWLPTVGGGAQLIGGEMRVNYIVWRRKE
jgi:hypothetical protein